MAEEVGKEGKEKDVGTSRGREAITTDKQSKVVIEDGNRKRVIFKGIERKERKEKIEELKEEIRKEFKKIREERDKRLKDLEVRLE